MMAGEFTWSTASGFLTNDKLNKVFQEEAQPLTRFRQFVTINMGGPDWRQSGVNPAKFGGTPQGTIPSQLVTREV